MALGYRRSKKAKKWDSYVFEYVPALPANPQDFQIFAVSSTKFLFNLAHFIQAFLPQFLAHYGFDKGFFFLRYYLDYIVYSFNITSLLLFHRYNLLGRRRFSRRRNTSYDAHLAPKNFIYKEPFLKFWRFKFRPRPWANVPMVTVKDIAHYRFIGVARSFRILEIKAYAQQMNKSFIYSFFGIKFFFKKSSRKAIPLFIFSYFWIAFNNFLVLRTYIYHWFAKRYNEFIAAVLGKKPYIRYALLRRDRQNYFIHLNIYHFLLWQFTIYFYFGHFIFNRFYRWPWKFPTIIGPSYTLYKNFFSLLPLLRNPELIMQWKRLPKRSISSVFFLESAKFYFMLFSYFLIQYSPKRYAISKCWIKRWIHFFCLGRTFNSVMRYFAMVMFFALGKKLIYSSVSNEFFYDWQLIDSFSLKKMASTWDSFWLQKVLQLILVDIADGYYQRGINYAEFINFILHWERLSLYEEEGRVPHEVINSMIICLKVFNLTPLETFLPFNSLMYAPWDFIHIDLLRDFFYFSERFPTYFARIYFDNFLRDYYFSIMYVFNKTLNNYITMQQLSHYKGRGRLPSRRKFVLSLKPYLYYFFARDVIFKMFFLSNVFPAVFYILLDHFTSALRRRKDNLLLLGHFLDCRRFLTVTQAKVFIPAGEESFYDLFQEPHWYRFYARKRTRFLRQWYASLTLKPYKPKWSKVYQQDWKNKRPLAASFYFMIYGVKRPRGRNLFAPEWRAVPFYSYSFR